MSAAAIRLRERLLALRDEQDTASPEFARLDRVATRLESARLDWLEACTLEHLLPPRPRPGPPGLRCVLAARLREARADVCARH